MIDVFPTTALMLYLGLLLTGFFTVWIFQSYGKTKKPILPLEKKLHICEFCHFPYLESPVKKITRCPRCSSYNSQDTLK